MRRDRQVVCLRHPGDEPELRDTAGVADVRLENHRRLFLENLPEAPLGKDALTSGERDVGLLRQLSHYIHIERLDNFFVEPGVIRLQRFDEKLGGRRLHRAVKVDGNIDAGTITVAQSFEALGNFIHKFLPLDVLESGPCCARRYFHRVDAGGRADRAVDADPVACRAAEQLIDRHAVDFALDVPERLIDSALDGSLDGSTTIEGPALNGLPVKHHAIGVLADQVASDFERSRGAGLGIVLEHLAPTNNAGVGGDLHEHP